MNKKIVAYLHRNWTWLFVLFLIFLFVYLQILLNKNNQWYKRYDGIFYYKNDFNFHLVVNPNSHPILSHEFCGCNDQQCMHEVNTCMKKIPFPFKLRKNIG